MLLLEAWPAHMLLGIGQTDLNIAVIICMIRETEMYFASAASCD